MGKWLKRILNKVPFNNQIWYQLSAGKINLPKGVKKWCLINLLLLFL